MPTYVSDHTGRWFPATEEVALINKSNKVIKYNGQDIQPGQPFIYNGPDRAALFELYKEGVEFFGKDFRRTPSFRQMFRNMGFNNDKEFFEWLGYDEEKEKKRFVDKISKVKAHEIPQKVREIKQLAGGKDFAGNKDNNRYGGFGDPR